MILAVAFIENGQIENHIVDTDLLPSLIRKKFILAAQGNKKVVFDETDVKPWEKLKKSYIDAQLPKIIEGAITATTSMNQ